VMGRTQRQAIAPIIRSILCLPADVGGFHEVWVGNCANSALVAIYTCGGEMEMNADPKRKPRQKDRLLTERARRRQEEALDDALKNTFPGAARCAGATLAEREPRDIASICYYLRLPPPTTADQTGNLRLGPGEFHPLR